jgi:hypothetical protein
MKALALVLALCGAGASSGALAWSAQGHRAVGAIADSLIAGTHAQQKVAALLQPGENLAAVADWPDCIKGTFCGPPSEELLAFSAANPRHLHYHYTDIPYQSPQYVDRAVGTADDDVVQILKQCIAALQGRDDAAANPHRFTPRVALLLLVHMTGDIHQPLHVGESYLDPAGHFMLPQSRRQVDGAAITASLGGSNLLLAPQRSFHAYWDGEVVDLAFRRMEVRNAQQFAQAVTAARPQLPADYGHSAGEPAGWPYLWAADTLAAARLAYDGVTPGAATEQSEPTGKPHKVWPLALPPDYASTSAQLARTQLAKGGYRLAAVLQAIWP